MRSFSQPGTSLFALISIALVALAGAVSAQSPFGEVVEVRVVNVEVVVTDGQGIRVTGLAPEDFRLRVGGEDVAIDYFSEIRGGRLQEVATAADGAAPQPATSVGGTSYLVFIDENFSLQTDRDRVLESLRDQLPQLGSDDRMALVAFDGSGLTMLSSWSQSSRQLDRVLRDAMARPSRGQLLQSQLHLLDRDDLDIEAVAAAEDNVALIQDVGGRANLSLENLALGERWAAELEKTVSAANATLRSFARPPGRKVMILLSGGWPFSPATWVQGEEVPTFATVDLPDGYELYNPLAETANRLGYTLYPVDVGGLLNADLVTNNELARFDRQRRRERETHSTFEFLARRTGGRALLDGSRMEAFSRVVEDTRSYYWLGFTVDPGVEVDRRKIRVKLNRPGLSARARRDFRPLSSEEESTLAVESALLFGDAVREAPLLVEVGETVRRGRRRMEVPVKVAIPLDLVTLLPTAQGVEGKVELRIGALDDDGNASDIPILDIPVRLAKVPDPGKLALFETRVTLRRERNRLVVSLLDPPSGRTASTQLDVVP
ncbi:MAG: VWA domain-containing protein [Acidobacteriota bacterium]